MSNLRPKFEVHQQNVDKIINLGKGKKKIPISFIVEKKINDNIINNGALSSINSINTNINEKKIENKNPICNFNNINIERGK